MAFDQIVSSCWRCKLAIRFEMHRIEPESKTTEELDRHDGAVQPDSTMMQWYGTSLEDLRKGMKFLEQLRSEIDYYGGLHLEDWKERIIKAFGTEFYDQLSNWKPMSTDTILMAEHLIEHTENFGEYHSDDVDNADDQGNVPNRKANRPSHVSTGKVVMDPRQKWQMMIKLIDMKLQHLSDLRQITTNDLQIRAQLPIDFVPRYFTIASRDLQKALDWFLYLRSKGL